MNMSHICKLISFIYKLSFTNMIKKWQASQSQFWRRAKLLLGPTTWTPGGSFPCSPPPCPAFSWRRQASSGPRPAAQIHKYAQGREIIRIISSTQAQIDYSSSYLLGPREVLAQARPFLRFAHCVDTVSPDVAKRHPGLLAQLSHLLQEVLTALLRQRRNKHADFFTTLTIKLQMK